MKKRLMATMLFLLAALVPAQGRVTLSVAPTLQYPLPTFLYVQADYRVLDDSGKTQNLVRFGALPTPLGTFAMAQYRRYFAPMVWERGASRGYWNVGWVGGTHDLQTDSLMGAFTGLGYTWVLDPRWSLDLEADLYPLALLNGVTVPGSWGLLFSAGFRASASYRIF
ncbi:hypothetical protein [Oceanithermus sp.]|uniref:hypothetical protein n=1 Tax=Oceanithermus sp. TaxID=2268145 RepID=UPI00257D491A|nr:hypothetical protein [Oceanithermus sp.]